MYTFLDQCPKCRREAVRVEFGTELDGRGCPWVYDLLCCTCKEDLDGDQGAIAACLEAAEAEVEEARYPDL